MRPKHALKDALLGLLASAVLLGVSEAVLALRAGSTAPHLSRGFDPSVSYFVQDERFPGSYFTRYREDGPQVLISPKVPEATRVLMFGGSNVQGFPHGALRDALDRETGSTFRVANLGCNGYGSERVAILVEQALELLEPDLLVIYTGHNEFTEQGFAIELREQWSSPGQRALAGIAARMRTVQALARLFAETEEPPQLESPEQRGAPDPSFSTLSYEETRVYFEALRANLRRIATAARERSVRLVFATPVYNRFTAPFVSTLPEDLDDADRAAFSARVEEAQGLLGALRPLLAVSIGDRLLAKDWGEEEKLWPERARLPGWRALTGSLADFDPGLAAPQAWSPKVMEVHAALSSLLAGPADATARAELERAEQLLTEALAIAPDHPNTLFQLGLVAHTLGRDDATVMHLLEGAADYARAPRKANRTICEIVASVADEFPEVLFVDTDRIFRERMPMQLTGWEVMIDHCHLNRGARTILMRDLAAAIARRWYGEPR